MRQLVLVLDFKGQYKELIARSIRNLNVFAEIKPGNISAQEIKKLNPIGIILTGGPDSVYGQNALSCDLKIFELGIPILGICYGMQVMCHTLGGQVLPCRKSEFGRVRTTFNSCSLYDNKTAMVLMSHTDSVSKLPLGFICTATTANCPVAACENPEKRLYGVQFHPEVEHTDNGMAVLKAFLFNICGAVGDYKLDDYLQKRIEQIRREAGSEKVLLALSGGVDSSVCCAMLCAALPNKVTCVFVDHGFMRLNEGDQIERAFADKQLNFIRVNAKERFMSKLKGVTDPEKKRKIIGNEFIKVFEEQAKKLGDIKLLAQGTIYPDIIESGGELGAVIKSHHNVGGLPETLGFDKVLEPLAELFKDEVRILGEKLGLAPSFTQRQPFPGPGLAIRIIGEVTPHKLQILAMADDIFCREISRLKNKPEQYFAVFTGVRTVGVKGDARSYDYVIALRAVNTNDFMTCECTNLSPRLMSRIAMKIVNEVKGVSRVVFDITGKPPATIEWE